MKSKNFDINKLLSETGSSLLTIIYKSLLKRKKQIILECGVNKGYSTSIFSYYAENSDSYCFSIDINDCKDVVTSERWTFIHSDDSKVSEIIQDYPVLEDKGIDILFIDSFHHVDHVKKLLYRWYPYLNKDSLIFIDDIDARSYRKGKEKDSYYNELNWEKINRFTRDFSENNASDTTLTQYFGKTGLAKIVKKSNKGSLPNPIVNRNRSLLLQIIVLTIIKLKNLFRVK
tara:strand:+ start:1436 stop:2125 length:690 start_codon:yes stop_codon:yes gene_type:complete